MMIDTKTERVFMSFLSLIQKVIDNWADGIFQHKKLVPALIAINQKSFQEKQTKKCENKINENN